MRKAWEEIPQLTIAAIEGLNVGGGVALALGFGRRGSG
jgi:enoyl-CoA hydratase/carnithine racemase